MEGLVGARVRLSAAISIITGYSGRRILLLDVRLSRAGILSTSTRILNIRVLLREISENHKPIAPIAITNCSRQPATTQGNKNALFLQKYPPYTLRKSN